MGLFSGVSADMAGLVFQTAEGLVTGRALVRTWQIHAQLTEDLLMLLSLLLVAIAVAG